jgi:prepilin-type N-terminal cleavage/methylation domain-containing protein
MRETVERDSSRQRTEEESVTEILERLKRRLPRNNQRGFTLIELLVVISILGILAAVVTMSMVGVTKLAQPRAADAEKATVQSAIDAMANEQLVPSDAVCSAHTSSGTATNDMTNFPAGAPAVPAPAGQPQGASVPLNPRYLRATQTHGTYYCEADGTVHQQAYNP